MSKKWDKFLLLMWKNWKMQLRHPVQTFFEILVPILFCIVMVIVRDIVETDYFNQQSFSNFKPNTKGVMTEIAYTPNTTIINKIMSRIERYTMKPFGSVKEMEEYLEDEQIRTRVGVLFDANIINELPPQINYTIRFPAELNYGNDGIYNWATNALYQLFMKPGPRIPYSSYGIGSPDYNLEGFLNVQSEVSMGLMKELIRPDSVKTLEELEISMNQYPYPAYVDDDLMYVLEMLIGMIFLMAYLYSGISIMKTITIEKEQQLKESMKIMGLPNWLHWTAWFVKNLLFMLISVIIIVLLLKLSFWYTKQDLPVFPHSDGFILFIFLLLYVCSIITMSFMVTSFFSKANLAAAIGGVLMIVFYMPFALVQYKYRNLSLGSKIGMAFLSQSAMGLGFQVICMYETAGEGIQWDNLFKPVTPDDTLTLAHILLMLIVDSILYMLICLYVEAIFPGEYGVPKKWSFIFTWMCTKRTQVSDTEPQIEVRDISSYEPDPVGLKAGIAISGLQKVYGQKTAVNNFTLSMYEDQITVLLGHNGAGKTTTMGMLTGMFPPTSGTAVVNGHDIRSDINGVRDSLGLCPQHNILFNELTVEEHIYFYSKLKGMHKDDISKEIDYYLKLLDFENKRKMKSSTLSGGMKRKLSVAVAFCGNSKVVLLDEPTAGMDPSARRALWELVQSQKKDRTILLTTHFMDEADLLGDRIAIMANGNLQCCGSSFFLKKKYGAGYFLIIDKDAQCDASDVTRLLKIYIPEVSVYSDIGSELTYVLNEKDSNSFRPMFAKLERESKDLHIRSYGVSLTTLQEVFLKVGADHIHSNNDQTVIESPIANSKLDVHCENPLKGGKLILNQMKAMFIKRALLTMRSWGILILLILMPIVDVVVSVLSARLLVVNDLPERKMVLDDYENPIILLVSTDAQNLYYKNMLEMLKGEKRDFMDMGDVNMKTTLLERAEKDLSSYRLHDLMSFNFDGAKVTAWFNNIPLHVTPLALNYVHNSVLKGFSGNSEIQVSNHPLSYTEKSRNEFSDVSTSLGFQLALNIGFCMAFLSACFVLFYVRERVCKVKHLQFVSGVNVLIFWFVSFVWDWIIYTVVCLILVVTLVCFQEDGYSTFMEIGHLFVIFIYFGFASMPLVYLSSFLFSTPSTGFIRVILATIIFGCYGFMIVQILTYPDLDKEYVAEGMDWAFMFIPHYAIATGIYSVSIEYDRVSTCEFLVKLCTENTGLSEEMCWTYVTNQSPTCKDREKHYYQWERPGILRYILASMLVGLVAFGTLFLLEYGVFARMKYAMEKKKDRIAVSSMDNDVEEEENRVRAMGSQERKAFPLVLQDLTKYYKDFLAVNGIGLKVDQRECFGLLGVNGAGKTTTFKMISGDEHITSGEVHVFGESLKQNLENIRQNIGYCPQFDALFDNLTARETIKMFCLLRGYPSKECTEVAIKLAMEFDFMEHLDKQVRQMSGGNKRKLSASITLIGDPPIIYLDEPTAGMDPATKRYLWNALCKLRDNGKCLLLTSHNMEECEALCTRLAIMVNGRFECIGSTQHLKNKFSQGYTLTIKLRKSHSEYETAPTGDIEDYIRLHLSMSVLRERHQEMLTYFIPQTNLTWSDMFGVMEDAKNEIDIEDYSIGQTSLEQVFLNFANAQIDQ